ncbi:hypothetical protein VDGL01_01160 [Verticillium dahliae]
MDDDQLARFVRDCITDPVRSSRYIYICIPLTSPLRLYAGPPGDRKTGRDEPRRLRVDDGPFAAIAWTASALYAASSLCLPRGATWPPERKRPFSNLVRAALADSCSRGRCVHPPLWGSKWQTDCWQARPRDEASKGRHQPSQAAPKNPRAAAGS